VKSAAGFPQLCNQTQPGYTRPGEPGKPWELARKRAGRGVGQRGRTDQVPRSSHGKQKGIVLVRDRRTTEGVMKFFFSAKTERVPLWVRP
jgi:hypothetical protein